MSPSVFITTEQEYFQRQIEEFNADQRERWRLRKRKPARRPRDLEWSKALNALLDAANERSEQSCVRWFGPVRWIVPRGRRS